VNCLVFSGHVLECEPLRYTPTGLPVLEMVLEHVSEVIEAGIPRRVELTLAAVALGDLAHMLADTPLGSALQIEGFLAPTRKGSRRLTLHVQQAQRGAGGFNPPVA